MNLEKQKEMQENLDYVRQRMPKEVELPTSLQGQYLLQKVQMQERKSPVLWKKWATVACCLVLVAMVGIRMLPQEDNLMMAKAAPNEASSYALAPASMEDAAMQWSIGIRTYTAKGSDAKKNLQELYPDIKFFNFESAEQYTVYSISGNGVEKHYAFLGKTIVDEWDGDYFIVRDEASGQRYRFDANTMELAN